MAGSYGHVIEKDGSLSTSKRINGMLECMSGDVVECVTEMYGMIWYLAHELVLERGYSEENAKRMTEFFIERAVENYKQGLAFSPTPQSRLWSGDRVD